MIIIYFYALYYSIPKTVSLTQQNLKIISYKRYGIEVVYKKCNT